MGARHRAVRAAHRSAHVAISPLARRAPLRRFVVVATIGRCGSELLTDLLDGHPEVTAESEILSGPGPRFAPARYVDGRAALAARRGARAYGFKLISNHLGFGGLDDPRPFLAAEHRRGTLLVVLRRQNLLQQSLSFIRAFDQGTWHDRSGAAGFTPLEVDPPQVISYLHALEWMTAMVEELTADLDPLTLTYEDDLADPPAQAATVDRITDRLGLSRHAVEAGIHKIAPRSVRDTIANYDEVADLVGATRFAWMLDDPGT